MWEGRGGDGEGVVGRGRGGACGKGWELLCFGFFKAFASCLSRSPVFFNF